MLPAAGCVGAVVILCAQLNGPSYKSLAEPHPREREESRPQAPGDETGPPMVRSDRIT